MPTKAQITLMNKGIHITDTPTLVKLGLELDELIAQLTAGAKAMRCTIAEYAKVHMDVCE